MPSLLRSRVALIALLGAFLIPILLSSLRGLTHVLTCQQQQGIPFTLAIPETGQPTISSSATIERGQERGICGGLALDMRVGADRPGRVRVVLPIANHTRYPWRGTVKLLLGRTSVPVDIGEIRAGATATQTLHVPVDTGAHEISGALLIGP